jgi:hypothetical protein
MDQGWHHTIYYNWIFHSFSLKPNHTKLSKIRRNRGFCIKQETNRWNTNDDNSNETMVLFIKIGVFALNQKPNTSARKK